MRHTYDTSEQTKEACDGHVKSIAEEMEVSDKHLYAILAGKDPYAPFRHLFRSVVRCNPNGARGYLRDLNAIFAHETHSNTKFVEVDLTDLVSNLGAQFVEFIESRLKDKPLEDQRSECRGIIEAACEVMERLEEKARMEECRPFVVNKTENRSARAN